MSDSTSMLDSRYGARGLELVDSAAGDRCTSGSACRPSSSPRRSRCAARGRSASRPTRNPRRPLCAQELPQGADRRFRCCRASTSRSTRASSCRSSARAAAARARCLHLLATLDAPDAGEILFRRPSHRQPAGRRPRHPAQPILRHDLSVLSPAARADDAGKRARAADDRRGRARLLAARGASTASGPARCSSWSASAHRLKHKPRELSGGEMQRTAIARALVAQPRVLLADEPTGNSTSTPARKSWRILRSLNREQNLTIVMVTHDSRHRRRGRPHRHAGRRPRRRRRERRTTRDMSRPEHCRVRNCEMTMRSARRRGVSKLHRAFRCLHRLLRALRVSVVNPSADRLHVAPNLHQRQVRSAGRRQDQRLRPRPAVRRRRVRGPAQLRRQGLPARSEHIDAAVRIGQGDLARDPDVAARRCATRSTRRVARQRASTTATSAWSSPAAPARWASIPTAAATRR